MRKVGIQLLIFLIVGGLAAACSKPLAAGSSNPTDDRVGTIVAGTMEAFLAATPVLSQTSLPSITPTPTLPLPVPPGWAVYWNEQYGIAFSHPNLTRCLWEPYSSGDDGIMLVEFLPLKDCPYGTDAFFDELFFSVDFNSKGLSFQEFIDQEKQHPPVPWNSQDGPGRPGTYTEEAIHYAGQEGVMLTGSRDGASLATAYIPFPNSQMILSFSIAVAENNFMETGREILSTLRFVNEPAVLAAMATQTAVAFIPPVETSRTEYADINELLAHAPFRLWLPTYLPEGISLTKRWVSEYADGSQGVGLIYSAPGDPLDATVKRLFVQMTRTDKPVTMESIFQQPKVHPQDLERGYFNPVADLAYFYWTPGVAAGNLAHMEWRAGDMNFHITLSGDWPQPDALTASQLFYDVLYPVADGMQPH